MNPIRPANMTDLESVITIVGNAVRFMDAQGIYQWDHIYPDRATLRADIENRHMHVIEHNGSPAGLTVLNEVQSPEYADVSWAYSGRIIVVHRLTIDPGHQRRKLASQLMDFAEREAASWGYAAIRLDAFTMNPAAIALYERRGYRRAGLVHFRKGPFFCYEKAIAGKLPEPCSAQDADKQPGRTSPPDGG